MADKQITRPIGLEPSWANDENANDPGKAWDGQPLKVEPGAGKRDDGWLPEEDVAAQHKNHILHNLGQWIQYLSDIQIQNWPYSNNIPDDGSGGRYGTGLAYDNGSDNWFATGEGGVAGTLGGYESEYGGVWFANNTVSFGGANLEYVFSKPDTDAPTHGGAYLVCPFAGNVYIRTSVNTWNQYALPGSGFASGGGIWCTPHQLILVGGVEVGPPRIWTSGSAAPAFTSAGITNSQNGTVRDFAFSAAGTVLAVGEGANADTWTSTDGLTWTLRPTTIPEPAACAYSEELGVWMIVCQGGECYTSFDAIAWTQVAALGTAQFLLRCLEVAGSLWVAVDDFGQKLLISTDAGVTWKYVAIPRYGGGSILTPISALAYSERRRQFAVAGKALVGSAESFFTASLSVGTLAYAANANTDITPTVT